ncbi:PIG-L family deacetylase [Kitasatospora sp. NPDC001175]|uniref:PIG-L family deacetylase n=1 Tax=Kitasatospora sp. NPDC001175 TaxID=3157103 RepID=UPI003D06A768
MTVRRPIRVSRRAVLAGIAALAVAGCTAKPTAPPVPRPRASLAPEKDGTSGSTIVQVVAHPDDDLYFMNPDLEQSIDANDRLVSVYLNCGESGGVNKVPGAKNPPKPDEAAYAGARRQGLRQAYGLMATGNHLAPWDVSTETLPDGTVVEVDTLGGHQGVQLVFLGVSQHFKTASGDSVSLPDLWANPAAVSQTLVSTGSPVKSAHQVTHDSLVAALAHLLDRYQPTLVRTLDPDPDMQVHDDQHKQHHDQDGYSDHPDHTAAALFTYAALDRHRAAGGRHYTVTAYRGYYNERWPQNLPAQLARRKADVLNAYGGSPDNGCTFTAGCGDYDVGQDRSYGTGWLQRTSVRYPATAPWLRLDADHRLTAFGLLDGQAAMWQESAPGSGKWGEPQLLDGDGLLPGITASLAEDGRWQLFAERMASLGPATADNRREIVTAVQSAKGGPFGAWTSVGNPESDPDHGRRVGGPVLARNADGTTQLFVRNWAKGVSTRQQRADGSWSDWTDLGGADVQEGLAAVTDGSGRIHVFGAGHDTVHHWAQQQPNGPFTVVATDLPAPADPPSAVVRPDGTVLLAYREAKTARPLAHRLEAGGTWKDEPLDLTPRGFGPLTLLALRDGILLAARNNDGGTSLATFGSGKPARWSSVAGPVVGTAALALDVDNRPVLARLGPDAALHCAPVP